MKIRFWDILTTIAMVKRLMELYEPARAQLTECAREGGPLRDFERKLRELHDFLSRR